MYVADPCGKGSSDRGRVIVFEHGGTKQTRYLYPGGSPYCLAVDSHDNLYVDYSKYRYAGQVKRYAPGARRGETLLPQNTVYSLTGIAFDDQGALLVANGLDGVIDVFTRKREPPTRIIKTGQGHPFSFAFDQQGARLYVPTRVRWEESNRSPFRDAIRNRTPSSRSITRPANGCGCCDNPFGNQRASQRCRSYLVLFFSGRARDHVGIMFGKGAQAD